MTYWTTLGINPTANKKDVKRAYARLLKVTKPDDDPVAYQALREAFDWAIGYCDYMASRQNDSDAVEPQQVQQSNTEQESIAQEKISSQTQQEHNEILDKNFVQEDPYQAATNLIESIFNADTDEQATEVFQSIIDNHDLLHLQTRTYFEEMSLNALLQSSQSKLHYDLLEAIATEFLWFDERQSNKVKANNINYLKRRLDVNYQYKHRLASKINSLDFSESNVAKLLTGSYKPKYFHLLRFIGTYNRTIRKSVNAFQSVVDKKLCPELETKTFAWWNKNLQRSLYSLWHCLVGLLLGLIVQFNAHSQIAPDSVVSDFFTSIFFLAAITSSLGVWGADTLYRRYFHYVRLWWDKVKGLYKTDFILSTLYLVPIWTFLNYDIGFYLLLIPFTTAMLLFGLKGVFSLFINWFVWAAVFSNYIDPSDQREIADISWVLVFASHKLSIQGLIKMPLELSSFFKSGNTFLWAYQAIVMTIVSFLYLFLVTA